MPLSYISVPPKKYYNLSLRVTNINRQTVLKNWLMGLTHPQSMSCENLPSRKMYGIDIVSKAFLYGGWIHINMKYCIIVALSSSIRKLGSIM